MEEQEQSGPVQPEAHSQVPQLQTPLGKVQLLGQTADESQVQSGPVQGGVHSQVPQLHTPFPPQERPPGDGQGRDEQLHPN